MIRVEGLTKTYAGVRAADDLTFSVESGKVTGFLGPNGAGTSTTMRMVLGLDRPTAGNGRRYRDFPAPLREVGVLLGDPPVLLTLAAWAPGATALGGWRLMRSDAGH